MFYYIIRGLVKFAFIFLGLKYEGIHNIPEKGPIIIAANHVSFWDPLLLAVSTKRPIYFMAKSEFFNNYLLAAFFKGLHAFPVKRGTADRAAIRRALEILEEDKVLGIFPEGTRKKDGTEIKGQTGAAMLAVKSGTEVVPVACIGTNRTIPFAWSKNKFIVRAGRPVDMTEYQGKKATSAVLEKLSAHIMREINLLLCE